MTNPEANEIYGNYTTLAVPMVNLLISLVVPLTVALLPRLVELRIKKDELSYEYEVKKSLFLTVTFITPCTSIYYFYSFNVLDILFASYQSAAGYSMLAALALGTVFLSILNVINTVHESNGKFNVTVLSLVFSIISKIIFTQILLSRTSLGVQSIPLATSISYFIGTVFSFSFIKNPTIKFAFIKICIVPILISGISYGLSYHFLFLNGYLGGGFSAFFFAVLISTFLYLSIIILCNLNFIFAKSNFKQKNHHQKVEL